MSQTIKIQKGNELRRVTLSSSTSFEAFQEKISSLFNLPSSTSSSSFALKYLDEDGDLITLSTSLELAELLSASSATSLRLQVHPLKEQEVSTDAESLINIPVEENFEKVLQQEEATKETETETEKEREREKEKEQKLEEPPKEEEAPSKEKETPKEHEQEKEAEAPSIDELFEGLSAFGTHIQQLLDENPKIQEDLEKLREQFSSFLSSSFAQPPPSPSSNPFSGSASFQFHPFARGSPFRGFGGPFGHPHHPSPSGSSPFGSPRVHPFPFHFARAQSPQAPSSSSASASTETSNAGPSFRRCQGGAPSCSAGFAEKRKIIKGKLDELESMGFVDRELNLHLLSRFGGDLISVVDELEKIHAQFAF